MDLQVLYEMGHMGGVTESMKIKRTMKKKESKTRKSAGKWKMKKKIMKKETNRESPNNPVLVLTNLKSEIFLKSLESLEEYYQTWKNLLVPLKNLERFLRSQKVFNDCRNKLDKVSNRQSLENV